MALQDSDIFLIHGPSTANPGSSYQIQAKDLFSGTYDDYYVLVNEESSSYKCKVGDLFYKAETRGGLDRILLVNRGDKSYRVTLTEILDKYGSFAAPGQQEYSGSGINGSTNTFSVPVGVRYISVICVGGGGGGGAAYFAGGGGGGGELAYRNNIKVRPGQGLLIVTGRGGDRTNAQNTGGNTAYGGNGGDTYIQDIDTKEYLCYAGGGKGGAGTPYGNDGNQDRPPPGVDAAGPWPGGAGGWSQVSTTGTQVKNRGGTGGEGGGDSDGRDYDSAGGGAAPGSYTDTGAPGQNSRESLYILPFGGTGGAAGGENGNNFIAGSGGGIGLKGIGNRATSPGQGGSGGASSQANPETGGFYGGGGGGQSADNKVAPSAYGGRGGARIMWGEGRSYPNNAADR